MIRFSHLLPALLLSLVATPFALAQSPSTQPAAEDAAVPQRDPVPYLLNTCPISGAELGTMGQPARIVHEGREVKFCCEGCVPAFKKDPAKHLAAIDAQLAETQRPIYPLDTCVISGEKLGSMGEPVEIVHENRLVRFCCAGCVDGFKADPAKHLAQLDAAAIEQQKADYPTQDCVVSGHDLLAMGEPVDVVVAGRLIRLCCPSCQEELKQNPAKYLALVDAAQQKKNAAAEQPADKAHDHDHAH